MKNNIRNYLCLGMLAVPAFAQESQPTSPAFEQARIVEELEHDLRGAALLYEELLAATDTSLELKGRALLRLGLVYRELGEEAKAHKTLTEAAKGNGDAALQAQDALAKSPEDTKSQVELREQARAALERVQTGFADWQRRQYLDEFGVYLGNWSAAGEDLVWLGSAAVPVLRQELEIWFEAKDDLILASAERMGIVSSTARQLGLPELPPGFALNYQAHLTSILWENGTPEARAYLSELAGSADPRRTWSLALGLLECGELNPRMLDLLVEFLGNPKTTIGSFRLANGAMSGINPRRKQPILLQFSPEQFLGIVRKISPAAAVDLWRKLGSRGYTIPGMEAEELGLAEVIRGMLTTTHPGLNQIGFKVLAANGLNSPALRRLTLEYLGKVPEDFKLIAKRAVRSKAGYTDDGQESFTMEAAESAALVEAIRVVGPYKNSSGSSKGPAEAVRQLGDLYAKNGGPEVLPAILALYDFQYLESGQVHVWLGRNNTPELIRAVFQAMKTSASFDLAFPWFSQQTLDEECLPGLMAALGRLRKSADEEREAGVKQEPYKQTARSMWQLALGCLSKIDSPKSVEYLLHLAKDGEYGDAAVALIGMSEQGTLGDLRDELRELLSTPGAPTPPEWTPWGRTQILARLVKLGDEQVFLQPNAWAGFEFDNVNMGAFRVGTDTNLIQSPLIWLAGWKRGEATAPVHGYTAQQLEKIWAYQLSHSTTFPNSNPFEYLAEAVARQDPKERLIEGVVRPASEAWVQRIRNRDYPSSVLELAGLRAIQDDLNRWAREQRERAGAGTTTPLDVDLIGESLRCNNPDVARGAIRALGWKEDAMWGADVRRWILDPGVGPNALASMARMALSLTSEELQAVVASPNSEIRKVLVTNMGPLVGDLPIELAFPLLSDESSGIRMSACTALAQRLDAKAVPALLNLLGDGDEHVRTAAKEALEQIRFYHDEKARWERFFMGQEVSTVGAAQRLLQQAAPDQPLEQRLLAIRSLGSLGAPEVLPFLIEWVGQGPEQVRAAGENTIEQILSAQGESQDEK